MMLRTKPVLVVCVILLLGVSADARQTGAPSVNVRVVTDEADAVLAVLTKRRAGQTVGEDDWRRVFESEGYVRLKKREHAMRRPFEDEDFRGFVLSDALAARAPALAETLARWKRADSTRAAARALRYLPPGARITAKVYPVIKPRDNSFVFEVKTDPAVFLYLDPSMSREGFENYLAHELHHIGYGTACPPRTAADEISRLPTQARIVVTYLGAFGEGFAMLAAAGGANFHPHAASKPEVRARWDRDVANFEADLRKVERFFLDVLAGRLTEEQIRETAAAFFGEQGPWYTVGWRMCALIEQTYGRRALVEIMCDQRRLLPAYNRAAARHNRRSRAKLPLWSPELIQTVSSFRFKV
jgi:hypothetical protein